MKLKTMLGFSVGFNVALAGALALVCGHSAGWSRQPTAGAFVAAAGAGLCAAQPGAFAARPGVTIETVLAVWERGRKPVMLDFETGRQLREPVFDHSMTRANIDWIKTNGMDIAAFAPEDDRVFCVCYYLAILPVAQSRWNAATLLEIPESTALNAIHDPKRRVMVTSGSGTDTFLFRTVEGASGLMQILGPTADRKGVRLHYKLLPDALPVTLPVPAASPITMVTD